MKNIILLTVTALFLFGSRAFAQNDTSFWNNKMAEIAMANSSPGWVRLKEDIQFIPNNFFAENKQAFGLKQDDNMILVKTETDDLGFTHYRYQHTYKEIKVEGCEYILHTQNNQVISANGKLACNLNFDVTPSISENTALSVALSSINATKYGWDVKRNDTTYWSNYPQGELILARIKNNKDFSENNYKLAYKFIIMGIEPFYSSHVVYVDAKSSEVIKKQSLLKDYQCNCCNGTAQTLYNGQQTIVTRHRGVPLFNYLLKDNCRGDGIQTYLAGSNLTDGDNNWSAISERPATSAHWAAEMTYDFYNNTYGRNSFDGNGKMIEVYTDETFGFSFPGLNAQWDSQGQRLRFGNGHAGIANALVSLDVVGHEFTHAVTENEANFRMIFVGSPGCGIASGEYRCDVYKLEATIPQNSIYIGDGLSGANPNNGEYYVNITNNGSNIDVSTFFYYIRTNSLDQTVNEWVPHSPAYLWSREYLSTPLENITFNGVINSGEFKELLATNSITLTPGFHAKEGSYFHAAITLTSDDITCLPNPTNIITFKSSKIEIINELGIKEKKNTSISQFDNIDNTVNIEQISIYPNPNKGNFTINIQGELSNNAKVEIYSLDGSLKYSSAIVSKQQNIIFTQTPGMYLIRIYNNEKKYTEKIILQ